MTVNIKDMIASLDGRFPMDETVLTCPPISPKSHTFEFFGKSVFTVTDKLTTVEADDTENVYFHKVTFGELGGTMLKGELESPKEI